MRYILTNDGLAPATRRKEDWTLRRYEQICAKHGFDVALPAEPQTLRLLLSELFGQTGRTSLDEYVRSITRWHLDRGLANPFATPMLQALLRVSRRACRSRQPRLPEAKAICDVIDAIPKTPIGLRDTAMQLLAYCTRASARALSLLNRGDVVFAGPGMRVHIPHAHGVCDVPVASYEDARYCPVAAMERYLQLIDDDEPVLFRIFNHDVLTTRRLSRGAAAAALGRRVKALSALAGTTRIDLRKRAIISAANRRASDDDIRRQFGYTRSARVRHWIRLFGGRRGDIVQKLGL